MNEVKFTKEILLYGDKKIEYEWASRTIGTKVDLVMHFFLKEKRKNDRFLDLLYMAAIDSAKDKKSEVFYTEDFSLDGHDLVIYDIASWKSKGLVNSIILKIIKMCSEDTMQG